MKKKISFLKKKIIEYLKKNKNFLNIISIRAYSYSFSLIQNKFKSKILNINFLEYINLYKVKNIIINIPSGVIQKNNSVIKNLKKPILHETLENNFYFNQIFTNKFNSLDQNPDKILKNKSDIYFFKIKENKSNYYHFVNDNFISLIFLLENYKKNFEILYNGSISKYINSYLNLISKVYKKKLIPLKNCKNILVKNNLIFASNTTYSKEGFFYKNNKPKQDFQNMINPVYSISNFPIKFKKENKNQIINNQFISNIISTSQYNCIDKFTRRLINLNIIKKDKKKNYFLARKRYFGFKDRFFKNEKKLHEFLKQKNFHIIYFDHMPIIKQIECMYNSNIVLGIHGANLTNSIYKIKFTTLIELYPSDTNLNADFYKYISEQRNLNYYRINCPSDKNNQLILNFNKFEKLLSKLLK